MDERNQADDSAARNRTSTLPNNRQEDVERDVEGMTRRGMLRGIGGVVAAGAIGAGAVAAHDTSVAEHDTLPTRESNWDEDLEMALSGHRLDTREHTKAHEVEIARLSPDGDWFLDVVDLVQWDGPDGEVEGEEVDWCYADDLTEGSTVVLLRAHNDRGSVVSPDAEDNDELHDLID